jgi:hypothetical protein
VLEVGAVDEAVSSGRLCETAIRAFDHLCLVERRRDPTATEMTPRQRSRRQLLETRAAADEWLVPPELAETILALAGAASSIEDPALAAAWTDHLPVSVLSCLERRSFARRLSERDPFVAFA